MRGKELIIDGDFNTTKSQPEKPGGTKVRDPFGEKMEDLISYPLKEIWGLKWAL